MYASSKKAPLFFWEFMYSALYLHPQLPDRLMVGLQFLVLSVVVRIHLGQRKKALN